MITDNGFVPRTRGNKKNGNKKSRYSNTKEKQRKHTHNTLENAKKSQYLEPPIVFLIDVRGGGMGVSYIDLVSAFA